MNCGLSKNSPMTLSRTSYKDEKVQRVKKEEIGLIIKRGEVDEGTRESLE